MHLGNRAGVNWKENSLKHTETWEHTSWPNSCNYETLCAHRIAAVRSQSNSGRGYENVGPQAPKTSHLTDSRTYNVIPWTVFGSLQKSYCHEYRTPRAPTRFQDMKDSVTTIQMPRDGTNENLSTSTLCTQILSQFCYELERTPNGMLGNTLKKMGLKWLLFPPSPLYVRIYETCTVCSTRWLANPNPSRGHSLFPLILFGAHLNT